MAVITSDDGASEPKEEDVPLLVLRSNCLLRLPAHGNAPAESCNPEGGRNGLGNCQSALEDDASIRRMD